MAARKTQTRKTASSKRKSGSKKTTARSRSNSKKGTKQSSVLTSRIFLVCLILALCALSIITIFRLGKAGAFLYGLLSLIMGSFATVFLISVIAFGFWIIWTGCRKKLPARFWIGMVLMMAGWSMCALLPVQNPLDPWGPFAKVTSETLSILQGTAYTYCGIAGAFLTGFFSSLFSVMGAWIVAITLMILSIVLVGWSVLGEVMAIVKENSKQAISSVNARVQENRQLRREAQEIIAQENEANAQLYQPSFLSDSQPFNFEEAVSILEPAKPAKKKRFGQRASSSPFSFLQSFSLTDSDSSGSNPSQNPGRHSKKKTGSLMQQLENGSLSVQGSRKNSSAAANSPVSENRGDLFENVRISGGVDEGNLHLSDADSERAEKQKPESKAKSQQSQKTEEQSKGTAKKAASDPREALANARTKPEETGSPASGVTQKTPDELIAEASKRKKSVNVSSNKDELDDFTAWQPVSYENYKMPKISLLNEASRSNKSTINTQHAKENGAKLISILKEFNVPAALTEIHIGPSVTKFEISPGVGVRVNTITNLQNDIKMALAATDIRIEAPIPGKSAVGIEVPNPEKTEVGMKELMKNVPEKLSRLPLVFALGKDLLGDNVYGRLDTMPHLLIAGATGSGKSVCVNSIISSILMRTRPDEVKMILVDPKKVEFTPYNGVPHLLAPVITDGDLANKALKVVVEMMDARYDLFEEARVRNINSFNAFVDQHPESHLSRLPRIVVIIDELADLMLAAAKEVEQSIQRITQLARAAGIHLIVATQRPSVNVITGVIKANIPSRIAFAVSSAVDSRTILDQAGAERLLGYGDMLFLDNGETAPRRIQGVFIKDEEVNAIANYVKEQAEPQYDDAFITLKDLQSQGQQAGGEPDDPLYDQIKHFVITQRKASTSLIQRRFSIGYARAARVMDSLEINGIIGPANGSKPREILVQMNYDDE